MKKALGVFTAYAAGLIFGVGLVLGGMTQPARIAGFLDFAGVWDPTLVFVMAGAVGVHLVLYRLVRRRRSPLLGGSFAVPTRRDIDWRLITGAAVFGVGWGLGGFCPGPGIVALPAGMVEGAAFVAAMLLGMLAYRWAEAGLERLAAARLVALERTSVEPDPEVEGV